MEEQQWTYQQAGVDVEAGYEAVRKMSEHVAKTKIPGVLGGLGSFGGMFELPQGYKEPVLVSGTDGVGTKLSIAFQTGKHDTIGIDCVAMCVNDIVCQGAKPLFFLDYIGTGVLDPSQVANIVKGISQGCINSGCALIGGETAEMPDFYKPQEYDLAGFAVGIVEKSKIITGKDIKEGDSLIGIASSGIHSNGYSLVRKLVETKQIALDTYLDSLGKTLGEELLTPTKLYVNLALALIETFDIKGMAHITGGGWIENIPRMFAGQNLKAVVNKNNAPVLPIFSLLKEWGNMTEEACYNTFNMGIGLVLAVSSEDVDEIIAFVQEQGEQAYSLGTVSSCGEEEERVSFV